jgi:translation initiation factor IF-3
VVKGRRLLRNRRPFSCLTYILCYYLYTLATEKVRINREITARELRVIGAQGENLGVLSFADAFKAAQAVELDLIEISPNAVPPVAKIMDYGKFQYELKKRENLARSKAKVSETKEVQIKVGTGDHDMALKAKKAAEWLAEGHRVRAELFLKGRYKGMDEMFLKTRLEKFLLLIPYPYRIAEPVARAPKGFAGIIERDPKGAVPGTADKKAPAGTPESEPKQ